MKKFLLLLVLLCTSLFADSGYYEQWLRSEGYYLLTPEQKERFKALPDPEKELYIRNLWAALDPNPLTVENEFQVEYQKRFEYAKKHFAIPSDRAKIYLLLGPPTSVERHHNSDKYFPLELWSYYSLGVRGLPPSLDLIFFKRWGAGDFRLYSPLFDGMKALTPSQFDFENPRMRAQIKAYFDAQIVEAAEHISIGATLNESETVRMTLQDPSALQRFERLRPTVETTVVYEGFEADVYTYAVPYKDDIFRTGIALAIPPKYLTFEKNEETRQGRVDLIGRITDEKGNEILRINDSPALELSKDEFEKSKTYFFSYLFDAYLMPGKYTLDCLFRDYVSNAAGRLEQTFEIKPLTGNLELLPTLAAFKTNASTGDETPFSYDWRQYYPKENLTFNNGQILILYTTLLNPEKVKLQGIWKLQISLRKDGENVLEVYEDVPISSTADVSLPRKMKLQSLVPGSYVLAIRLIQGETTIAAETPVKIATDAEVLGRMRVIPPTSHSPESDHTNVALQQYFRGNLVEAAKHVRIAIDLAPSSYAARSLSARIEKARGNTDVAIAAYEKLIQEAPGDSEGHFLIGKWSLEKQDWGKASEMLKKAISLGYYTKELLNDLAQVEIHLGNTKEAIECWEKSLALDSNQPEIQRQITTHKQ